MILLADTITPRLRYMAAFAGTALCGEPLRLTTDPEEYRQYPQARINYSNSRSGITEIYIRPVSLLFETGIREQEIRCVRPNGYPVFFTTEADTGFDFFAASFYLLSRYEEYNRQERDTYGRFPHTASLAWREGFLHQPLIHYWLRDLAVLLKEKFPGRQLTEPAFRFLPTYDVDEAFCYRHKGWVRSAGGLLRDLLQGKTGRVRERMAVLLGREADPFASFDRMESLHQDYSLSPVYFFHVGSRNGRYDKQVLPAKSAMQELIRSVSSRYKTGLHPSWQSGDESHLPEAEKKQLSLITGKEITASRQHFIRFLLPDTFRQLINTGIREDYSMGYGSINGFRASVSMPFYWYDLERETATDLLLFPFCFMDANCFYEQGLSPIQAGEEMRRYYREVKETGGLLITIWHNTFLGTDPRFRGWKDVYAFLLEEISQGER